MQNLVDFACPFVVIPTNGMNQYILSVMTGTIYKHFLQTILKVGANTKELFQRWRSFQFDETTDSHVLRLKQCVQVLRCNEGQVLELTKNALSTRYYYLLIDILNHREAVESDKHVMSKEKVEKLY